MNEVQAAKALLWQQGQGHPRRQASGREHSSRLHSHFDSSYKTPTIRAEARAFSPRGHRTAKFVAFLH